MAAGKLGLLALGLLFLGGDDGDSLAPPPTEEPENPNEPKTPIFPGFVKPVEPDKPGPWTPGGVGPQFPGHDDGPGLLTLPDVFDGLLKPTPTAGGLWQVTQGTNLSNALVQAYGAASPAAYQAVTECQWNWGLYAVQGQQGTVWSRTVDGVLGQITAAFFKMHENAAAAADAGRLPQRLILWNKGTSGQVQPRNVADLPHPMLGLSKTLGCLYFPPESAFGLGRFAPSKNPMPLFDHLGLNPEDWNPWED